MPIINLRKDLIMNEYQLRELQLAQLSIVKQIDLLCKENEINYSVYGGTAIGAIRNGGFIPWDDDVDLVMTRDNYKRFLEVFKDNHLKGLEIECFETNVEVKINHAKVKRIDSTVILVDPHDQTKKLKEKIWVDIFPVDRIKNNRFLKAYVFLWNVLRTVLSRRYPVKDYGPIIFVLTKGMLRFIPRRIQITLRAIAEKKVQICNDTMDDYLWVSMSTIGNSKKYYPEFIFQSYTSIKFEDTDLPILVNCDALLRLQHGDYMELPPLAERVCKHQPIYVKVDG